MAEQKNTELLANPQEKLIPVEIDFPIGGPTPEATIRVEGDTKLDKDSILTIVNPIEGTENPDILFSTPESDLILAKGGDDTIIGSLGNDTVNGGAGFDTLDYSFLGRKITLLPQGLIGNGNTQGSQIQDIERIVGSQGKDNTIDGSGGKTSVFFTINLADELLVVENIPGLGSVQFEVENFVNVEGTENADSITGSDGVEKLSGNGGNDTLVGKLGGIGGDTLIGGAGDDTLIGSDPSVSETSQSERDILTGGTGVDKFVLGNNNGSFYDDFEGSDFAEITDFSFGETIQLSTQKTYNVDQVNNGFNVFVVEGSSKDLIAKVALSGFSNAKTIANEMEVVEFLSTDILEGDFNISSGEQKGIFVA